MDRDRGNRKLGARVAGIFILTINGAWLEFVCPFYGSVPGSVQFSSMFTKMLISMLVTMFIPRSN